MPDNELSRNIRLLRKKSDLTQEQLADMVGVSAQAELNSGASTDVIYRFLIPERFIGLMVMANDMIEGEVDKNV